MKPEKAVFRQKRFTSPLLFGYNGFKEKELKRELDSNNGILRRLPHYTHKEVHS